MGEFSFPKKYRLRKNAEYKRVYNKRKIISDKVLKIYWAPSELDLTRMGMAVARRHGKAYLRNRIKRLFREAFRLSRPQLPIGLDLVLIPHFPRGKVPSLESIQESLIKLVNRMKKPS